MYNRSIAWRCGVVVVGSVLSTWASPVVVDKPIPTIIVAGQSNAVRLGGFKATNQGQVAGATVYSYLNPGILKKGAGELDAKVTVVGAKKPIRGNAAGIVWELAKEYPEGFAIIRYGCWSSISRRLAS